MKNTTPRKNLFSVAFVLLVAALASACDGGANSNASTSSGPSGSTGVGGSTARMVIVDNYLYAIVENQIQLFDISIPSAPNPWTRVTVDWNIQTLFPYDQYLLVGAADGVHILDNSDPAAPFYIADFRHGTAIDPVVATKGYAYVTLKRDSSRRDSIDDQMNVIDISDVTNPRLVRTLPMQSPEGLSTVDDRLFVCDGVAGLKQFELSDPANPKVVDVLPDVDCNDVITVAGILYVITDTSVEQYDYSVSPPAFLSKITTNNVSKDAIEAGLRRQLQENHNWATNNL